MFIVNFALLLLLMFTVNFAFLLLLMFIVNFAFLLLLMFTLNFAFLLLLMFTLNSSVTKLLIISLQFSLANKTTSMKTSLLRRPLVDRFDAGNISVYNLFSCFYRVLSKVAKYRGVNREKNDLNAATWFTQPGLSSLTCIFIVFYFFK